MSLVHRGGETLLGRTEDAGLHRLQALSVRLLTGEDARHGVSDSSSSSGDAGVSSSSVAEVAESNAAAAGVIFS